MLRCRLLLLLLLRLRSFRSQEQEEVKKGKEEGEKKIIVKFTTIPNMFRRREHGID